MYKWQYSADNGISWKDWDIKESDESAVKETEQLQFTAKSTLNGYHFRCVVSDAAGQSVESESARLTVGNGLLEGPYVTPQMFANSSDADDTAAFNRAIAALGDEVSTVYVPSGDYRIDPDAGIALRSGMKLQMAEDARLVAKASTKDSYNIIRVANVQDVEISGGNIIGDREIHVGSKGEWGHGIGVYDSERVIIRKVNVSNCWGDGIYIGTQWEDQNWTTSSNIQVSSCYLQNNRRNNMSITAGDHITIDGCEFWNANGTDPGYGLDIETNNDDNPCEDIKILNCRMAGNYGGAFAVERAADNILIQDCKITGDVKNLYGSGMKFRRTHIRGKLYTWIGVDLDDETVVNEGTETADELIAEWKASDGKVTADAMGGFQNINHQVKYLYPWQITNVSKEDVTYDAGTENETSAIRLQRVNEEDPEAGYFFYLGDLTKDQSMTLEEGVDYRIEYNVRGNGNWGYNSDQTGWYPINPASETDFGTGMVTYTATKVIEPICKIYFYAVGKVKDMWLELKNFRIFKVL